MVERVPTAAAENGDARERGFLEQWPICPEARSTHDVGEQKYTCTEVQ
jgi:hypothetical protein